MAGRWLGKVLFGGGLALLLVGTSCLGALPEPLECATPEAVHPRCAPLSAPPPITSEGPEEAPRPPENGGPPTDGRGARCNPEESACLRQQGRSCACDPEACATASVCFPRPDCPRSIREASPGARCLETGSDPAFVGPAGCSCGCASCASSCDGQGPILFSSMTLRLPLVDVPASGNLRAMVRLRGTQRAHVIVVAEDDTPFPLGEVAAPEDFQEIVVESPGSARYTWSKATGRPTAIEVRADEGIEVDCVVPFVAR